MLKINTGQALKSAMVLAKVSNIELAEMLDLTVTTIVHHRNSKSCNTKLIERFCATLKIEPIKFIELGIECENVE